MSKILITGNSGYIGSHLTNVLSENHITYGLDKTDSVIPVAKFYKQDITNVEFNIEDEFDCIIHLAAVVSVSESVLKPWLYYNTNINGTFNVLKNIKTKSFILASTGCAEYMNNPYGISKKAAEDIVAQYCKEHNIDFTIFRFYNVIGATCRKPTNPDGLFWNLLKAKETGIFYLYGDDYNTKDGSAIRDYLHVNEVCHSIKNAINNHSNTIENLGHGIGMSVKEMVDIFKKVNDCDFQTVIMPRRDGDLEQSVLKNVSLYMTKLYDVKEYLKI